MHFHGEESCPDFDFHNPPRGMARFLAALGMTAAKRTFLRLVAELTPHPSRDGW
jgi:hypothetical protein